MEEFAVLIKFLNLTVDLIPATNGKVRMLFQLEAVHASKFWDSVKRDFLKNYFSFQLCFLEEKYWNIFIHTLEKY